MHETVPHNGATGGRAGGVAASVYLGGRGGEEQTYLHACLALGCYLQLTLRLQERAAAAVGCGAGSSCTDGALESAGAAHMHIWE